MKKTITEIESIIEERIAELEEEYELDIYDRNDIREEEYKKGGWKHDPFPEELEEEETEEEEWHYRSMEEQLNEVGMSMRISTKESPKGLPSRGWGCSSYPLLSFVQIHRSVARCLCTLWLRFCLLLLLSRGKIQ